MGRAHVQTSWAAQSGRGRGEADKGSPCTLHCVPFLLWSAFVRTQRPSQNVFGHAAKIPDALTLQVYPADPAAGGTLGSFVLLEDDGTSLGSGHAPHPTLGARERVTRNAGTEGEDGKRVISDEKRRLP